MRSLKVRLGIRFHVAVALAGASLVAVGPVAAETPYLHAKVGVTLTTMLADQAVCEKRADDIRVPFRMISGGAGSVAGVATSAFLAGWAKGREENRLRKQSVDGCMRQMGYARVSLTPAEVDEERQLGGVDAKRAWAARWLQGIDADRIAAASVPIVAPLPRIEAEPFTVGAAKLDAASLQVVAGPIARGGLLVSGQLRHRAIAKATAAFVDHYGPVSFSVDEGAIFYAVEYVEPSPVGASTIWCGPVHNRSAFVQTTNTKCFQSTFDDYRVYMEDAYAPISGLRSWMFGPPADEQAKLTLKTGALHLTSGADDPTPTMDLELRLTGIGARQVWLEAAAMKDKSSIAFWKGQVLFDKDGVAVLPFWTRRLVLRRDGNDADRVVAALTPDGDGRGWTDTPQAPATPAVRNEPNASTPFRPEPAAGGAGTGASAAHAGGMLNR